MKFFENTKMEEIFSKRNIFEKKYFLNFEKKIPVKRTSSTKNDFLPRPEPVFGGHGPILKCISGNSARIQIMDPTFQKYFWGDFSPTPITPPPSLTFPTKTTSLTWRTIRIPHPLLALHPLIAQELLLVSTCRTCRWFGIPCACHVRYVVLVDFPAVDN